MNIYYNSHMGYHKTPFGAVRRGQCVTIKIKWEGARDVFFCCSYNNSYSETLMQSEADHVFSTGIDVRETGLVFYFFKSDGLFYANNEKALGGEGSLYFENPVPYQISVYEQERRIKKWFAEGIAYQIFPDRFRIANAVLSKKPNTFFYADWKDMPMYIKNGDGEIIRWEFYGGNLKGISQKLGYLLELGVNILYLNPIFEASSNHRYNTADFFKIDSILGSMEDFKELIHAAHEKGMKIILDGVFSHVGADSIYFNKFGNYDQKGACQGEGSPYYDWFYFEHFPNQYKSWWGVSDLPCINKDNQSYLEFITGESGVVAFWMKMGIDGWRLDVADELPDTFIRSIKERMESLNPESVLIGEVWEDASNKISYGQRRTYFTENELDCVMNYPFREAVLDFLTEEITAHHFKDRMLSLYENYPTESFYCGLNLLSTHDTPRIFTLLSQNRNLLKTAYALLLSFPGTPQIYYGDETCLAGGSDPDNRRTFPWGQEDADMIDHVKLFCEKRKSNCVLRDGKWDILVLSDHSFEIRRYYDGENAFGEPKEGEEYTVLIDRKRGWE